MGDEIECFIVKGEDMFSIKKCCHLFSLMVALSLSACNSSSIHKPSFANKGKEVSKEAFIEAFDEKRQQTISNLYGDNDMTYSPAPIKNVEASLIYSGKTTQTVFANKDEYKMNFRYDTHLKYDAVNFRFQTSIKKRSHTDAKLTNPRTSEPVEVDSTYEYYGEEVSNSYVIVDNINKTYKQKETDTIVTNLFNLGAELRGDEIDYSFGICTLLSTYLYFPTSYKSEYSNYTYYLNGNVFTLTREMKNVGPSSSTENKETIQYVLKENFFSLKVSSIGTNTTYNASEIANERYVDFTYKKTSSSISPLNYNKYTQIDW